MTAQQEGRVIARIPLPGRREGRGRLPKSEPLKLNKDVFNRNIASSRGVQQSAVEAAAQDGRVDRRSTQSVKLKIGAPESADYAVFGGGSRIDRQRHTGPTRKIVAETIPLT